MKIMNDISCYFKIPIQLDSNLTLDLIELNSKFIEIESKRIEFKFNWN
jgi:hypothetical protein